MRALQIFPESIRSRFSPGWGKEVLVGARRARSRTFSLLPFLGPGRRPWEFRFSQLTSKGDSLFDLVKEISFRCPKVFIPYSDFGTGAVVSPVCYLGRGQTWPPVPVDSVR